MTHTPPSFRNEVSIPLSEGARDKHFCLPVCDACQTVQYPPREICGNCLADELNWREIEPAGILLAKVALNHSLEDYFMAHMPWPTGTVRLHNGAVMITHLLNNELATGAEVDVQAIIDPSGQATLVATPKGMGPISWQDVEQGRIL